MKISKARITQDGLKKRKKNLQKELVRIVGLLVQKYRPQKILLFGSLSSGRLSKESDIDLLVIKETSRRYWDRIDEILHLTHPEEPLDLFVLTPKEIKETLKDENPYLEEILSRGKVLYEKTG